MTHAYCWKNGRIDFGGIIPEGALPIKENCSKKEVEKIKVRSRLAYDNRTHLVPGVPEARNDNEAIDALLHFIKFLER